MAKGDFQFVRVAIVGDTHGIFSEQFEDREIAFDAYEDDRAIDGNPELVLLVNRSDRDGERIKARFPSAQVVLCQGSRKTRSSSRIRIVYGNADNDAHWFADWDGFFQIVGQPQERLPRLIEKVPGERDHYRLTTLPGEYEPTAELGALFSRMLRTSLSYLTWHLQWTSEVARMQFDCLFELPTPKQGAKKVDHVSIPVIPDYTYRGVQIFHEGTQVTFFRDDGSKCKATVEEIDEVSITLRFERPMAISTVNRLVTFQPKVSASVAKFQQEQCRIAKEALVMHPALAVISGQSPNGGAPEYSELAMETAVARKLSDDRSQLEALSRAASVQVLSLIHGPAGTGKSFVTSQAVRQCVGEKKRVLVISHSNRGLDTQVSFIREAVRNDEIVFRLGNDSSRIVPENMKLHRSVRYQEDGGAKTSQDAPDPMKCRNAEVATIKRLANSSGIVLACTMASFLVDGTLAALRKEGFAFDVVFIDEASRGYLHEVIPIICAAREKVILIGDPDQLGNIDLPVDARQNLLHNGHTPEEIEEFSAGWFTIVLQRSLLERGLLRINRRSLHLICEFISQLFYDGELIVGRFDPDDQGTVELHDTSTAQRNGERRKGNSFLNAREANIVVERVVGLLRQGVPLEEIGIITPYRAQIDRIRGGLRQALSVDQRLKAWRETVGFNNLVIESILHNAVNTVDAFQGSQRKVILISFVRSNPENDIGFNRNVNRLRVACTRAEDFLIIVGNIGTFLHCGFPDVESIFAQMAAFVREHGKYRQVR